MSAGIPETQALPLFVFFLFFSFLSFFFLFFF